MSRLIGLLRAVNVGGREMAMAELRELCRSLGWTDVDTFIQSGNILFRAPGSPTELEAVLEQGIEKSFGYSAPVMIRQSAEVEDLVSRNPFPKEAEEEPERVLIGFAKNEVAANAADLIMNKALAHERVTADPSALWFHYPEGVARSKITPAVIDRAAGSPVTTRNFRTVQKLLSMANA